MVFIRLDHTRKNFFEKAVRLSLVNTLLRQEAAHVDLALRFRRLPGVDDEVADGSVRITSRIAKA